MKFIVLPQKAIDRRIENLDEPENRVFDFKVGLFVFQIYTLYWLWERVSYLWFSVPFRLEKGWVIPSQWLGKWLFGFLHTDFTLALVSAVSVLMVLGQLWNKRVYWPTQSVLFVGLLFVNAYKTSFGFLAHVDHLFLLAHFLLITHPRKGANLDYSVYFLMGILFTYTLAGLLKVVALAKTLFLTNDPSWLHPGVLWQQVRLHMAMNESGLPFFLEPLLKNETMGVVLMSFAIAFQTFAVFSVFNKKLLAFYCILLLAFHGFNYVVFQIYFHHAMAVVFCFLFPFSWFRRFFNAPKLFAFLKM